MMKKLKLLSMALFIGFMATSTFINLDSSKGDIQLKSLFQNAQATGEIIDGTYYQIDERLKHPLCILPLFGTSSRCKPSQGDKCDPSNETDCKGGTLPDL